MLADVYDGVGLEDLLQPAVERHILVRGRQVWTMVNRHRIIAIAASRLHADEDIAVLQAGDDQCLSTTHNVARRRSPGPLNGGLHRLGKVGKPVAVRLSRYVPYRLAHLLLSDELHVLAAAVDERVHQLIPILREITDGIPRLTQ